MKRALPFGVNLATFSVKATPLQLLAIFFIP
jgi:hypothetical protein